MNAQQLAQLLAIIDDTPTTGDQFKPGMVVFIRTVTMHHIGRIVDVTPDWFVLDDCSWVADSGRFSDALTTGTLNETERFPDRVWVGRGAIVDVTLWNHPLPTVSK